VIHLVGEQQTLEAPMAETGKQEAEGKGVAKGTKRSSGRLQVRRDTAPYRAAGQEQAARVREEIDTALAEAQRIRAEIEARIETQWHNRPAPKVAVAKSGRRRRAKS
jgi:hypothetical protein